MANNNPIKTTDPGTYPSFIIPEELKNETLYITTSTKINENGWRLDLIHILSIDGEAQDFDPTPDIEKQGVGICADLNNLKFALCSIATRIRNGADNNKSTVTYKLTFEAGSEKFDEFELVTGSINPATLYTKITFKVGS